jgi:trimeric autotransporter adhesin
MATYVNNLRLKEITTGDEDGTWGTSTNTNLELITDGFSYGTKEMAADANETFSMPDGTADDTRSFYLKFTSAVDLTATREITLGPNTVSKTWIIENATTGGQIITIKQGSGATVNVPNGSKVMIVTDGAGAGAAVFNANPTEVGGTVTSVGGTGTVNGLTLTGTVTTSGNLTLGGTLANVDLTSQVTGTLPIANGGTGSTSTTYVDLTTNVTGTLPVANGGTGVTSSTGTGSVVLSSSPTLTTPNLGTPSAATLTNATGLPLSTGVTGQLPLANGGTGASLVDPDADRILFWDDSTGAVTWLGIGSGLALTDTTLSTTDAGGTVTSVGGTGTVNGLTMSGTVTTSGSLTLGGTLAISNADWSGTDLSLANGGTGASLVDPNADRIFFWDDSAGSTAFLTVGSGLQISGTTLSSTDAGGTVTSVDVSGGTTGLTTSGGPITGSGTITLAGTLAVANGGTGATTLTANNVILGNGTSAVQAVAPGTSGNVLTSDGTTWVSSAAAAGLTGVTDSATPFVTALGSGAAGNVTTGLHNLAIGYRSLCAVTTSCSNTAVGNCTLTSFTSGISVHGLTAFGFCALRSVTGTGNAGFGCCALASNSSGTFNAAFGNNALGSASAADSHTAVGHGALRNVVSPIGNTAVGSQAGCTTSTGIRNTSVGNQAHYRNSTGSHNVAIGDNALQNGTTGCNNIAVGTNAASTTVVSATPTGFNNVTTESNRITMGNDSHDCALIKIAWTVVSDCRDKTCFKEVPHGIDFVRALKPTEYQFKKKRDLDEPDGVKRYGFLAQDIMALEGDSPVVASADDPNKLKYNEAHMVPILVNAIKDLADEIEKIKDFINKM